MMLNLFLLKINVFEQFRYAHKIWTFLKERYRTSRKLHKGFSLWVQLTNYQMDTKHPLRWHITKMEELRSQAQDAKITLEDHIFALTMLNAVLSTSDWGVWKTTITSLDKDPEDLEPEYIVNKILEKEAMDDVNKTTKASLHKLSQTPALPKKCLRDGCKNPHNHTTEQHWENGRPPKQGNNSQSGNNNNRQGGGNRGRGGYKGKGRGKGGNNNGGNKNNPQSGQTSGQINSIRVDTASVSSIEANNNTIYAYTEREPNQIHTKWMCDTGCTSHVTNTFEDFIDYQALPKPGRAVLGNSQKVAILGIGKIRLKHRNSKGSVNDITLRNVLYVPEASGRYFSPRAALGNGRRFEMVGAHMKLFLQNKHMDKELFYAKYDGASQLFWIEAQIQQMEKTSVNQPIIAKLTPEENYQLWHQRLLHPGKRVIEKLPNHVKGVPGYLKGPRFDKCGTCEAGKATRQHHAKSDSCASRPLELLHMDLLEMPCFAFRSTHKWIVSILDDYTSRGFMIPISHKDHTTKSLHTFITWAERQLGYNNYKVTTVRVD